MKDAVLLLPNRGNKIKNKKYHTEEIDKQQWNSICQRRFPLNISSTLKRKQDQKINQNLIYKVFRLVFKVEIFFRNSG